MKNYGNYDQLKQIVSLIQVIKMESMQQTVFRNLGQQTEYRNNSRNITEKHLTFPKFRHQEIENQFDIVDLHSKGKLTQNEIITYLSDKYEWINVGILKNIFKTMKWEDEAVEKKEFSEKYLMREKQLYHEINGLRYYRKWTRTMQAIFDEEKKSGKPRVYFYTQIREIELYFESKKIEWMDLKIEYENHEKKVNYTIEEDSHEAHHPSFEIWLPAQRQNFFLKFYFLHPANPTTTYGQAYLTIPITQRMPKKAIQEIDITRDGKKIGHCKIAVRAEPDMSVVKQELSEIIEKESTYRVMVEDKIKEYEYLQFLWGVRHRAPHKVSPLDVGWMLWFRLAMILILGILGVAIHVMGRCEPMVLIVVFLMIKNREYVLLRSQKFLITWLTLSSILIDIIWISLASNSLSQINFIPLDIAEILTYILLVCKGIFFIYMLGVEKSLVSD